MLKILRRKLHKSLTPSPENVQLSRVSPSNQDIEVKREMTLTMELRNTLSTFQSGEQDTVRRAMIWTALLPLELIYSIIDDYYSVDLKTLRALAGTCKILSCYCRRHIYHTVIVGPGTDRVANKYVNLSLPERFARLVVQAPYILDHIQKFHIMMQNCRRRAKYDPLNREEESIAFLLTRRMKKLRQFKIRVGLDWILLPDRLQNAISIIFQSPVLNDVIIAGIQGFPLNLLLHIKSLEHLYFCCDASPPSDQERPSSLCVQPKTIRLHDPTPSTVRYLFGERSSLSTSKLHSLSVFGNTKAVSTLETYFPLFSLSLTRLEIDPETLGRVPTVPNLGHLPILRDLALTVDISLSQTLIGESIPRWQWLIDTLNTCYKPSTIQEIHIVVHTNSPKNDQLYDWRALDSVFTLSDNWWPALRVVDISICAEFGFEYSGTFLFNEFLPGTMINLRRMGVNLRGRYTARCCHGQYRNRVTLT